MSSAAKQSKSAAVVLLTGQPQSKTTVIKLEPKSQKKKAKARSRPRRARGPRDRNDLLREYINTLKDPFEYGPIRLGWGTFTPTLLATLWFRGNLTTAADGSLGIACQPAASGSTYGSIMYANSGFSTATWSSFQWQNLLAVQAMLNTGRVVSVGIKAYPQVPATSAPGFVYAGAIPSTSAGFISTSLPSVLVAQPYMKWGQGSCGAIATGRPVDPGSYTFNLGVGSTAWANTSILPFTVPLIVFVGLPASSTVLVEMVLNIEGTPDQTISTVALEETGEGGNLSNQSPTLTEVFPNVESMFRSVKSAVGSTATIDSIQNLISTGSSAAIRAAAHGVGAAFRGGMSSIAQAAAQTVREQYFDGMGRGRTLA